MSDLGKLLIFLGFITMVSGVLFLVIGKIPGAGKWPGDILIRKENFSFYFPITTCILLSVLISLVLYFIGRR